MVEITLEQISPEQVVDRVRNNSCGCVVTYVGLIRNNSQGKDVLSVEYQDVNRDAENRLQEIIDEVKREWPVENVTISHRIGKLKVGEVNLVVAIASAHRSEGFTACQYVIDQFKQRLPTKKIETYQDGSIKVDDVQQGG